MRTATPLARLRPRFATDALGVLAEAAASGDDVARFRIGPVPAVVVSEPAAVREVLVGRPQDFPKGRRQHAALRPVLGHGLLTSEGDLHSRQRRMVQPSLVPARVDGYVGAVVEEVLAAVERWPRGAVDVVPHVNRLAMDVVGRLLFGRSMQDEGDLAAAIGVAFEWEMRALTAVVPLPSWLPTPANRRMRAAVARVDERLSELAGGDAVGGRADVGPTARGPVEPDRSLVRRLVDARDPDGEPMPREQLLDEVRTLWGAAHETSADAQVWCLELLAHHPRVQTAVAAEADAAFGPPGGKSLPDREGASRTPYALQVFKETMRLFPPAAAMMRVAVRSTTLGGVRLKAGTPVFVSPWVMHRREDLFPDPGRFDPDRFSVQREAAQPRHAYLPFGAGRRVCIGSYLALLEGQVLTSLIAQRLHLAPTHPDPTPAELVINLRPTGPVRLRVTDRRRAPRGEVRTTGPARVTFSTSGSRDLPRGGA